MTLRPANYKYYSSEETSLQKIGPIYADIELLNFHDVILNQYGKLPDKEIRRVRKSALVNSGEVELVINEEIKEQLDLPVVEMQTLRLADETLKQVEMVGPLEIRLENESAPVRAMVLPGAQQVLMGRITLAGLHLFVDSQSRQLCRMSSIPIKQVSLSI